MKSCSWTEQLKAVLCCLISCMWYMVSIIAWLWFSFLFFLDFIWFYWFTQLPSLKRFSKWLHSGMCVHFVDQPNGKDVWNNFQCAQSTLAGPSTQTNKLWFWVGYNQGSQKGFSDRESTRVLLPPCTKYYTKSWCPQLEDTIRKRWSFCIRNTTDASTVIPTSG